MSRGKGRADAIRVMARGVKTRGAMTRLEEQMRGQGEQRLVKRRRDEER